MYNVISLWICYGNTEFRPCTDFQYRLWEKLAHLKNYLMNGFERYCGQAFSLNVNSQNVVQKCCIWKNLFDSQLWDYSRSSGENDESCSLARIFQKVLPYSYFENSQLFNTERVVQTIFRMYCWHHAHCRHSMRWIITFALPSSLKYFHIFIISAALCSKMQSTSVINPTQRPQHYVEAGTISYFKWVQHILQTLFFSP